MSQFTEEGQRVAATPCPTAADGRHVPDETQARLGTFFCSRCGAIPRDSVHYDIDGGAMGRRRVDCFACDKGYNPKTKKTCTTCDGKGNIYWDEPDDKGKGKKK